MLRPSLVCSLDQHIKHAFPAFCCASLLAGGGGNCNGLFFPLLSPPFYNLLTRSTSSRLCPKDSDDLMWWAAAKYRQFISAIFFYEGAFFNFLVTLVCVERSFFSFTCRSLPLSLALGLQRHTLHRSFSRPFIAVNDSRCSLHACFSTCLLYMWIIPSQQLFVPHWRQFSKVSQHKTLLEKKI